MKKINRLKKNWEFNEVINSKQQFLNKYLIVYYIKANSFKVGLTVPKKFANAVQRNYYKRQLRAIIQNCNLINLEYHFVMIVRKDFFLNSFLEKEKSIRKLFEKFKNEKIKTL
ncbi:ribonuclease P protein component [Mycoplasmopsis cricetuli]|uniref:ribonuclease P protein component n=1 Tax=Mycoplasmopsis cricetuli TaxID=171283 RepID=UPI00047086C3|nr:ribonuclease P protein component [Mycoplasmopsis cricetuli]